MKTIRLLFLFAFLLFTSRAEAVIAVANPVGTAVDGVDTVTTANVTTSASGSLFLCDYALRAADAHTTLITDSKSNVYANTVFIYNAYDYVSQGGQDYKENGTGGAGHNFTITFDLVISAVALVCKEVTGALTSAAFDKVSYKEDNNGTTGLTSDTTATTTQNDELFAGAGTANTDPAPTFTAQSGFTEDLEEVSTYLGIISARKVVSTTQGAVFTYDSTQAGGNLAWVTTWKAITAAPAAAKRRIVVND